MRISYATYDPVSETLAVLDPDCPYAEAVANAQRHQSEVCLMVDDVPVYRELPHTFERLIVLDDGQELRSAVLRCRDIQSRWGPAPDVTNRQYNETFGGKAPLLTFNNQAGTIQLRECIGDHERFTLLWPREELPA